MKIKEQEFFAKNLDNWITDHKGEVAFIEKDTLKVNFDTLDNVCEKNPEEINTSKYFIAIVEKDYQLSLFPGI